MKIFKKRGEMTHFQILGEVSKNEYHLRQKDIAERLDITVQAVSENIKALVDEGYISSQDGRAPYKITQKGLNKVKKDALILKKYADDVLEIMNYYKSIWPAIATENIGMGDEVSLYMDNGLLYAKINDNSENNIIDNPEHIALAKVLETVSKGDDVPLSSLHGNIELAEGQVVIITLPTINQGGSRATDFSIIKNIHETGLKRWGEDSKFDRIAVMGTISHVVANKLNISYEIEFAVPHSTVAATKKGLNVLVLAVGGMTKSITKRLDDEKIKYNTVDGHS
ncbi:MAG: MarR family transcriptional regulator [Methanobacteriaceae archaeon]